MPSTSEAASSRCQPRPACELQVEQARQQEREHLARELHDELGAILTAAKLELACLRGRLGVVDDEVERRLQHLAATLNAGMSLKSRIVAGLSAAPMIGSGLGAALDRLAREFSLSTGMRIVLAQDEMVLPSATQMAIYRVVQECLTNAARHARAGSVKISVLAGGCDDAVLIVADDGCGFEPRQGHAGQYGLAGMRRRVEACGGQLRVESGAGRGTRITAAIPRARAVPG